LAISGLKSSSYLQLPFQPLKTKCHKNHQTKNSFLARSPFHGVFSIRNKTSKLPILELRSEDVVLEASSHQVQSPKLNYVSIGWCKIKNNQ
jgi:hypothetical protein